MKRAGVASSLPQVLYTGLSLCLWAGLTFGFPGSGVTSSYRQGLCGSGICDVSKQVPEYCNKVEVRCESCTSQTCSDEVCKRWDGCRQSTAATTAHDMTTGDKPSTGTGHTDDKQVLKASIDRVFYAIVGVGVVLALLLLCLMCRSQLTSFLGLTTPTPRRRRGSRRGSSAATGPGQNGPVQEENAPFVGGGPRDSGIQDSDIEWVGQQTKDQSESEATEEKLSSGPCDLPGGPSGVRETQFRGKPASMVM